MPLSPPTAAPTAADPAPSRDGHLLDEQSAPMIYAAIGVTTATVLIADFYTPLGVAVWIGYLIPVTLALGLWRPRVPLLIAAVASVLILTTFLTDDEAAAARGQDGLATIRTLAQINRIFGFVTIWVMALVGYYFIRNRLAVRHQQELMKARTGLSFVMAGEQRPEQFGDNVLKYLANLLGAQAGALFIREEGRFRRVATYGVPAESKLPDSFVQGDGLLGQAAKDGQYLVVNDIPDGYFTIGSALGAGSPKSLLAAPMMSDGTTNAVLELGFFRDVDESVLEIVKSVSESVSVAVRSGSYRMHLQNLLEETQRQAEELQVQSEELRVANEELEEQSRALQESQTRLEQQQIELEQNNAQLEEQTQILESQKDELGKAQAGIEEKARELERASRYKSEFLANMSHELRTPLNSSLILARLLADNPQGNLTEDQVRSAQTIYSAGNDLLALINDILDLSKIEAGHMEIRPELVWVAPAVQELGAALRPLAEQKGLTLNVEVAPGLGETIETDRQRLEQILKNLLSNAIKFTDRGNVTLRVAPAPGGRVAFAVADTGIGIAPDQQQLIFEAFRQVDSAANRRYSGTGLGLSITRQLTRLLGGEILLASEPGRGSTFTLVLPLEYDPAHVRPAAPPPENAARPAARSAAPPSAGPPGHAPAAPAMPTPAVQRYRRVKDDRERLTADGRVILIVEDDEAFARILYDLARELDFQCLIATTAEEALAVATQHLPSAIVLDVGLPDQSGLSVLDRLKHDSRTRHIPVHIVSGSDYATTALSLGAVGYMLKPVTREKLVETLKGLETRLVRRMRRVLVVEDDPVQLESVGKLLGSRDVETVGVRSAAECLERLKESTYDCMVLDLSLPDASGYSLLETLSREDAYSFPPVIVYTGRDLSPDEEHALRKYSKSIIIKGAKSPERLLDEVTLFLHQVVAELPAEQQRMIQKARSREAALEGRRILVVEDDVRNVFALTSVLEPRGAVVRIARNGREALDVLEASERGEGESIDLVLMDVMMPEMDGLTATREIRKRPEWKKLPIIVLTAKAMKDDQENCFAAGASDYMAKPLDVDKLLSLVRVWIRS